MNVVTKRLSELRMPERNIRRHTDKQISEYIRSLEMFGQVKPVLVDENGEIIAGNGLYIALTQMGRETCDCYVISGLSSTQKKKLMLADNRVYELGITDMDAFDEIVKELDGDVDVPGWDEDLLAMMNASFKDVDDMVSGYGAFDGDSVEKLSAQKRRSTEQYVAQSEEHTSETSAAKEAQVQKTIICPKCGECICL